MCMNLGCLQQVECFYFKAFVILKAQSDLEEEKSISMRYLHYSATEVR